MNGDFLHLVVHWRQINYCRRRQILFLQAGSFYYMAYQIPRCARNDKWKKPYKTGAFLLPEEKLFPGLDSTCSVKTLPFVIPSAARNLVRRPAENDLQMQRAVLPR